VIILINTDIDQFTLVLQSKDNYTFDEWHEWGAIHIVNEFLFKAKLLTIFKNIDLSDVKLPEGYTFGYAPKKAPFYFCIAYNESFSRMGVIVKFSAHAWAEYKQRFKINFNENINLHNFFKMIESTEYTYRLSRVDVYCDFINEGIDIDKIKRSLENKRLQVRYLNSAVTRKNNSKITYISDNFKAQTIYIGAKTRNTKSHLRIYDKKAEQLS